MLAHHYQIFENLPLEQQGGKANSHSYLDDEAVQTHMCAWLTAQRTGSITPKKLQHAINNSILPDLNIFLKNPLSERTACCWLVKPSQHQTLVRKGIYMDGHEHNDVVKHRHEVFLPMMAQYEACMTQYKGLELKAVEPSLQPDEKKITAQFHDKCCFHANDSIKSAW